MISSPGAVINSSVASRNTYKSSLVVMDVHVFRSISKMFRSSLYVQRSGYEVFKGWAPLLMTYFTGMNHNIWDHNEIPGRLLLAKIVGCYIPCSITFCRCIGYIFHRNDFSILYVLVWVGNKDIVTFHEVQCPKWRWCQIWNHGFLTRCIIPWNDW